MSHSPSFLTMNFKLLKTLAALLAATLLSIACQSRTEASSKPQAEKTEEGPTLILLLVADQVRGDLLDRYDSLFTGGLRRLLDSGAVFANTHHLHAVTHTATGHATLSTGLHPRRHGIVANWWVPLGKREMVEAVDDPELGESPRKLLGQTLGDWIKEQSPHSRSFAISAKDRSALFLAGLGADGAFWFEDEIGAMVTSGHYFESEPDWLAAFNDRHVPDTYWGRSRESVPVDEETLAALDLAEYDLGPLVTRMPTAFGRLRLAPDERFYTALLYSPWMMEVLAAFAEHLISSRELGTHGSVDILSLSFSATDRIGHRYGPDSREYLDALLTLDQVLGELLEFIDRRIGLDRVVVAFTSDHGAAPVPEGATGYDPEARRVDNADLLCLQKVARTLSKLTGHPEPILPGGYLNPEVVASRGREQLERWVRQEAEQCPAVVRLWTRTELEREPDGADRSHQLFANGYYPGRSPEFSVQYQEYFVPTSSAVSTHDSPYSYDTWVPLIFLAREVESQRIGRPARAIDVAPTLSVLAGFEPPEGLDGESLLASMSHNSP